MCGLRRLVGRGECHDVPRADGVADRLQVRGGLAQLFQAQALVETDAARPNREYLKVLREYPVPREYPVST